MRGRYDWGSPTGEWGSFPGVAVHLACSTSRPAGGQTPRGQSLSKSNRRRKISDAGRDCTECAVSRQTPGGFGVVIAPGARPRMSAAVAQHMCCRRSGGPQSQGLARGPAGPVSPTEDWPGPSHRHCLPSNTSEARPVNPVRHCTVHVWGRAFGGGHLAEGVCGGPAAQCRYPPHRKQATRSPRRAIGAVAAPERWALKVSAVVPHRPRHNARAVVAGAVASVDCTSRR